MRLSLNHKICSSYHIPVSSCAYYPGSTQWAFFLFEWFWFGKNKKSVIIVVVSGRVYQFAVELV